MNKPIYYHKKTAAPVQLVAQAKTMPNYQDVVCYQELTSPYDYFVMERRSFFSIYVSEFDELPVQSHKAIEKRKDLPDKYAEKGIILAGTSKEESPEKSFDEEEGLQEDASAVSKMNEFLDAKSITDKIRIFDDMKDADDHILTNIAVSMDISVEDTEDIYGRIRAELQMKRKYELNRSER